MGMELFWPVRCVLILIFPSLLPSLLSMLPSLPSNIYSSFVVLSRCLSSLLPLSPSYLTDRKDFLLSKIIGQMICKILWRELPHLLRYLLSPSCFLLPPSPSSFFPHSSFLLPPSFFLLPSSFLLPLSSFPSFLFIPPCLLLTNNFQLPLPGRVVDVTSGGSFTLALLEDGSLFAVGKNTEGQLGNAEESRVFLETSIPEPVAVLRGRQVKGFGCGLDKSFAVLEGGEVIFWGDNSETPWWKEDEENLVHVPEPESEERWKKVFQWLFLGKLEKGSGFFLLPVEIIFHAISVMFS
jgi:hypothetical protein